ncbi:MAG: phytoene desaturase family protein [Desulfobacterota bacterium]|nr:phytoene desaturase family protein [Thermodesulfobacteriota bacterium]
MAKKIAIIGAGPGGLAAGMILARRGFDVSIYEKDAVVGGRNKPLELNGYTFDTGPTFLMMKFILDEMFQEAGTDAQQWLDFIRLDPMYRLRFVDKEVLVSDDHEKMKDAIKRAFPGEETGLERFLQKEGTRLRYLFPCLQKPYSSIFDMVSAPLIKALPHLDLGTSVFQALGRYFSSEQLRICFTFQSKYLGMSAWECPAAFAMIAYIEHNWGIYHVRGGLNKISHAMAWVFRNNGGKLYLSTPVTRVLTRGNRACGVELADGTKVAADDVVVNADFSYAVTTLMDRAQVRKYAPERLARKKYSCSIFLMYLGINKRYDQIPHHNIFFAKNYRKNVEDIFTRLTLSDEISFYVHNAAILDHSLAPPGKSTIYILVPVPNLQGQVNWKQEQGAFRERVLEEVVKRTEMKDLRGHIEVEKVYTPETWRDEFNVYYGATFNLGHTLRQMLYFRPHNRFECLENCYLVGGGTHPGSGLPTIYESGRIAANLISKKYGVPFTPPTPLDSKM